VNTAANYVRDLYVMSVDNTSSPKTITVKFNGAPPNSYYIDVTSAKYGKLSATSLDFRTSSTITSYTPMSGSVLGGTLMTITGTNFSPDPTEMAVKVGDSYCHIESINQAGTEITCRIQPTTYALNTNVVADVLVFLAASFESTCNDGNTWPNGCKFNYVAPVASVSTLIPSFEAASNSLIMTLTGTGFSTGDASSISLVIDGIVQQTRSVDSDTSAVFQITNVLDTQSADVNLFFNDGFASGFQQFRSMSWTPTFVSVFPNTGASAGGTLITVTGTGFGLNTKAVTLVSSATGNPVECV